MPQTKYLKQNGETIYPVTSADNIFDLVDKIYPVGSIYMSVNNTNPGTLFGGTWEQLQDKFLLGAGSSYTNGATGGSATVTLTTNQIPAHTHGSKTLTGKIDGIMMDDGRTKTINGVFSASTPRQRSWSGTDGDAVRTINFSSTHEHTSVGGGQAHDNMPPYLVVYMWKRTA